jgi:GTP-binding protein
MKIKSAQFLISAPNLSECPESTVPEVAFIGRSNVGKSSLINMLTERRDLARVSDTPGKTQLINFYLVNGAWVLVDLPGYGFAKVAKEKRATFNEAVADYIEGRKSLARVFVLIDSRLEPQPIDLEFLGWLQGTGAKFSLVFTKIDKEPAKVQRNIAHFRRALQGVEPEIFACSAVTRKGRTELLAAIAASMAEG